MIITGEQIRAALAALYWTRKTLAEKSGINARTIQRIAETRGASTSSAKTIGIITKVLEVGDDHGHIEFIESGILFHGRINK